MGNLTVAFVLLQLVSLSLVLIVPAVAGFTALWSRDGGRYRAFPISFAILFVLFLTTGGKFYYLGPYYPILLAAGSVVLATTRWRWAPPAAMSVFGVLAAIAALPVLPPAQVAGVNEINNELGETIGWPQLVVACPLLSDPRVCRVLIGPVRVRKLEVCDGYEEETFTGGSGEEVAGGRPAAGRGERDR